MPHGVHAKDQVNVRFPPDVLARLKDGAKRHQQTMTDIVVRGTEAELDRLDGIATRTDESRDGDAPPAGAEQRQPRRTAKPREHAPNCKCGTCKLAKEGKR